MDDRRDWHRLLGVILQDFCRGSPLEVDLEKDLSLKQQWLDVILLHKRQGAAIPRLPDGFETLAVHNLITFKSHQETLDGWALKELSGHYVNYRKQVSPSMQDLLPETAFRLFAISVRYPSRLAQQLALTPIRAGVYDCVYGLDVIRLIVVNQLAQQEHNAMLHLFSASEALVRYGAEQYRQRSPETTTLLHVLLLKYRMEGMTVQTIEEFIQEGKRAFDKIVMARVVEDLSPELRKLMVRLIEGLPAEERLKGLPAEERLKGLPAEERLKGLSAEELRAALRRLENGNAPSESKSDS